MNKITQNQIKLTPSEQMVLDAIDKSWNELVGRYEKEPTEDLRVACNEFASWRRAIESHFYDRHLEETAEKQRHELNEFIKEFNT